MQGRVILHLAGRLEHRPRGQALRQRAAGHLQHGHQFRPFGRAQALDRPEILGPAVQQAGKAAKTGEQPAGQGQHPLARQAGAQQQGQQFRIGQRGRALGQQFLARAGLGRQVFQ